MDEFIFSALVCINTLIRQKNSGRECALVIKLTQRVLKNNDDDDDDYNNNDSDNFMNIVENFNALAERINDDYIVVREKLKNAVDVTNWVLQYIYNVVENVLNVKFSLFEIKSSNSIAAGWQTIEAPWVWIWIHITTILLDLNCGLDEKIHYINFIANVIGCTTCLSHYMRNKNVLIKNLSQYSLSDLFLQLHSHITNNKNEILVLNTKNLINLKYKYKYQKMIVEISERKNKITHKKVIKRQMNGV